MPRKHAKTMHPQRKPRRRQTAGGKSILGMLSKQKKGGRKVNYRTITKAITGKRKKHS